MRGEVETEAKVLVLKRIHVRYSVAAPEAVRETVERVHRMHATFCPVYRSIERAIHVTTTYELRAPEADGLDDSPPLELTRA